MRWAMSNFHLIDIFIILCYFNHTLIDYPQKPIKPAGETSSVLIFESKEVE